MHGSSTRRLLLAAVLTIPLFARAALPPGAAAAPMAPTSYSWSGALSGDWTNPGNWDPAGVPGQSDPGGTGILPALASTYTITNTPQVSIGSLVMRSSYQIGGDQLTIGPAGISVEGDGGAASEIASPLNLPSGLYVSIQNADVSLELSGLISGTGGLIKEGAGTLLLSNSNSYAGQTDIRGGTLQISSNTALGDALNSAHVQDDGVLRLAAPGMAISNTLTLHGTLSTSGGANRLTGQLYVESSFGSKLEVADGSSLTLENMVDGVGGLTKLGGGTLTLASFTGYDGLTRVQQGILELQANAALGGGVGATEVITGAQLRLSGDFDLLEKLTLQGSGPVGDGALLILNAPADLSTVNLRGKVTLKAGDVVIGVEQLAKIALDSTIVGAGRLVKDGDGTLLLRGGRANSFSGGTLARGGYLGLQKPAGVVALPGPLVIGDGTGFADVTLFASNQIARTSSIRVNQDAILDLGGQFQRIRNLTMQDGLLLNPLNKVGTLTLDGKLTSLPGPNGSVIYDRLVLSAGQRVFQIADGPAAEDLYLEHQVRGAGGITKTGAGTLLVCGSVANTYQGATIVKKGTVLLVKPPGVVAIPGALTVGLNSGTYVTESVVLYESPNQIANTAAITVNRYGLLALDGYQDTIGRLTLYGGSVDTMGGAGAGRLTLNGNLVAGSSGGTASVYGQLSFGGTRRTIQVADGPSAHDLRLERVLGTAGFNKAGAGTLALTVPNSYGGSTSVNAGTLLVMASGGSATSSGAVLVKSGAKLGGSGVISGSVTILDGGTLAPGDQPGAVGALDMKSLLLSPTASVAVDLGTPGLVGDSDALGTFGSLTLDGVLNARARPGFGAGSYTLFSYGGALKTNNGEPKQTALTRGRVPAGFTYQINTATAGQVRLLVSQ